MISEASARTRSTEADEEVLHRLEAARTVLEALLAGYWYPEPEILEDIARLLWIAARWAHVAEEDAA